MTATYLRNNWYQAAWASELGDGPLACTLLDEPIVFFRTGARIAALQDRCPHRFAPLSAVRHAFMNEDKPMLEAQQRHMGGADFWSLRPVLLPGDAAAIRVRRELAKLIETEGKSAGGDGALNLDAS
jgi:phenylpropionate dioxygenase-like ring-hydroxylating dioxygenase large terminal subunit